MERILNGLTIVLPIAGVVVWWLMLAVLLIVWIVLFDDRQFKEGLLTAAVWFVLLIGTLGYCAGAPPAPRPKPPAEQVK